MEWAFTTGLRTSSVVAMFLLNAACKAEIVTNVPRKPTGFGNLAYSVDPLEGEEALDYCFGRLVPKKTENQMNQIQRMKMTCCG